jgi:hypothetical protein
VQDSIAVKKRKVAFGFQPPDPIACYKKKQATRPHARPQTASVLGRDRAGSFPSRACSPAPGRRDRLPLGAWAGPSNSAGFA